MRGCLCLLVFLSLVVVSSAQDGAASTQGRGRSIEASQKENSRFRSGDSFKGTLAYDREVGYDLGSGDDNGRSLKTYAGNRGKTIRMPGKRSDPGDVDYADFYYQGILINDGRRNDHGYLDSQFARRDQRAHGRPEQRRGFVPLRYDDFQNYQQFRYDLGGDMWGDE